MEAVQVNSKIFSGEPCIAGTRIPVRYVAFLKINKKLKTKTIVSEYYTHLSEEQVDKAVEWYIKNNLDKSEL